MSERYKGPSPAQGSGDPENPRNSIWLNVAETKSEYSQLRATFEIKEEGNLGPGRYIVWLKWRDDWGKWTGPVRKDDREVSKCEICAC